MTQQSQSYFYQVSLRAILRYGATQLNLAIGLLRPQPCLTMIQNHHFTTMRILQKIYGNSVYLQRSNTLYGESHQTLLRWLKILYIEIVELTHIALNVVVSLKQMTIVFFHLSIFNSYLEIILYYSI